MKSGAAMHPIAAIPAAASHLEMVQIAPQLQKLDTLLEVLICLDTTYFNQADFPPSVSAQHMLLTIGV